MDEAELAAIRARAEGEKDRTTLRLLDEIGRLSAELAKVHDEAAEQFDLGMMVGETH